MVRATFEGAGHQVRVIADPPQALSSLLSSPPDALILDIVLPGTSGWEILRAVRAEPATSSLPVLLLSSLDGSSHRVQGLREGASDYLTKPFVPDELLLRVEHLLEKAVPSSADLEGNLENFPFWELLQSLQQGRRNGRLELKGAVAGTVDLRRGAVVEAQQGQLQGKEAILALSGATGGRFLFQPTPLEDEGVDREVIFVNGLIMTAAVLQDELDRRRSFLPPADQPLLAVPGKLPARPEALQGVPVEEIYRHLLEAPGASWRKLLEAEVAAPQTLSLSLAWLCEQALVAPRANASDSGAEASNARATVGGSRPVHQLVLCQPEAWQQLLQRLEASSDGEYPEQERALCEQLTLCRGGSTRMRRKGVAVYLHVLMLKQSTTARALAILPLCSCVVLWLAGAEAVERARPILRSFDQRRERRHGIIVAPTGSTFRAARQQVGESPFWNVSSAIPGSLTELADLAFSQDLGLLCSIP